MAKPTAGLASLLISAHAGKTNADALMTKLEEALSSVKELAVQLRSKSDLKTRAPSCTPCRNGAGCKYLACGVCWFSHPEAERTAAGCTGKDITKFIVDTERKLNSFSSKIQADISMLGEVDAKVKALEGKVSRNCAETEARISNMARSGEKDAADTNGKMDDLADALINLELAMQENLGSDIPSSTRVESMRSDIIKDVHDKLDSQWLGTKLEFEAAMDCKIDVKAKAAVREILGTDVRSAIKELVAEAVRDALRVAFECFPLPMQEEMEANMEKLTCAEYDERKGSQ